MMIRTRLLISFGLVIVLIVIVAVVGLRSLTISAATDKRLSRLNEVHLALLEARRNEKNYLLRSNEIYVQNTIRWLGKGENISREEAKRLVDDHPAMERWLNIINLVGEYEKKFQGYVNLLKQANLDRNDATIKARIEKEDWKMVQTARQVHDALETISADLNSRSAEIHAHTKDFFINSIIVAIVFAIVVIFLVMRTVTRSLGIGTRFVKELGEGRLDAQLGKLENDEIGQFLRTMETMREIVSNLRQHEQQLEQAYNRLNLLDREKSQMAVRATHELKAPFAAIKSYVYTLRDGYCGTLPEKAQQVVERIGERCDLVTAKITSIIHLSNLRTATPENTRLSPVNLMEIVVREVVEARLIGQPRGITVHYQPEKIDYMITGSEDHLQTMIANLLHNALSYSHEGGIVEISLESEAGKVYFHVQDHGIGIPLEHVDKIFQEHFRTHIAVRHNPNSSGMGLTMVQEIVRLLDGEIHVASELGFGTRFTVIFGLLNQQPEAGVSHGEDPNH